MNVTRTANLPPPISLPLTETETEDNHSLPEINQMTTILKGRTFKTAEIPPSLENNVKISKVTQAWTTIAQEKIHLTSDRSERLCFVNSNFITQLITRDLKVESIRRRMFTCSHEDEIRSIALAEETPGGVIYLSRLATHPHNIRSAVNPQTNQTPYASTAVMHHLFHTCLKEGKVGIKLAPLKLSKPFYRKLKFKPVTKHSKVGPWAISSEEIEKHLKKIPTSSSSIDPRPTKRKKTT